MNYVINVALNGKHFFATAERSATTEWQAALLFTAIREKFPEADGYSVTCTQWETVGHPIAPDELLKLAFEK